MRRRRLALRQIAETTQDVSDIDGDDSDAQQQSVEEPTFNLLTVTTGPGLQPTAILLSDDDDDDDGDDDQALQPHGRTALPSPNTKEPAKKQSQQSKKESAGGKTFSGNSSIFNLYQEGLAPDQVLQLAFTRRRAPRSLRMKDAKPGDDFVLPLPTVSIADLLPSTNVDIRDLFPTTDAMPLSSLLSSSRSDMSENTSASALMSFSHGALSHAFTSAKKFFFTPEKASIEERGSWQLITESEWSQLYQDLQKKGSAVATLSGPLKLKSTQQHQLKVPSVDSVCLLLRDCRSDALAHFVWETLLLPVLENQLHRVSDDRGICTQELLRLLLLQNYFRVMAPKDFRAKVRAKQFRQQLSDPAFGAEVELQLLTLYHSNRQSM